MKRFVLKLLIFSVLLIAFNTVADFFLYDDIHPYTRMMLEEMYNYDGNIDTLFIGSSRAYRSFDVALADRLLNRNTFNAGSSAQSLNTSYYLLKEVAQYHSVNTVYLEIYFSVLQKASPGISTQQQIVSDYMKNGENKFEFLWNTAGPLAILDNIFRYRHSTKDILKQISTVKAKMAGGFRMGDYRYLQYDEEEYRGNGFVYSRGVVDQKKLGDWSDAIDKDPPISEISATYLSRIVDFCKSKGIMLVLITAPMPSETIQRTEGYQAFSDYISIYAERKNLEYYDFNFCKESALSLGWSDFQDNIHLNGTGAEKFTKAFCRIMDRLESGDLRKEDVFFSKLTDKWKETLPS